MVSGIILEGDIFIIVSEESIIPCALPSLKTEEH